LFFANFLMQCYFKHCAGGCYGYWLDFDKELALKQFLDYEKKKETCKNYLPPLRTIFKVQSDRLMKQYKICLILFAAQIVSE